MSQKSANPPKHSERGSGNKPFIGAKWILYAILLYALLHMLFFFLQTFFTPSG